MYEKGIKTETKKLSLFFVKCRRVTENNVQCRKHEKCIERNL